MADILTDRIVQKLSKLINPGLLSPDNFSVELGFTKAEGNDAAIGANLTMNQHGAFDKLLSKYVMKHGRKSESALQLRQIFLESGELKPCADFIKAEIEKFNIPVPSDAETLVDTPVSLPSPLFGTPEPVTVHQSGGDQTINASGRSKVKGSTMTGTVTNLTVHNHPAEASTSQRQGRKRKAAGSSGVKKRAKMGDAVHEESDEAAPSGSRPKRKRKPATVRQSGGDQTINASGRSRVEGSTMTGPVTNMTIHNPPPEASSSQRKRKAAGSSGGKKKAKMGGKR